jgi:hypothetical protein
MMRKTYKLSGERRFLDKALEYAELSIDAIMDETSPLPKATNKNEHYEANSFMSSCWDCGKI